MRTLTACAILAISALACCTPHNGRRSNGGGDTIQLRHARNITLVMRGDTLLADLRDPWDTAKTLRHYELATPLSRAAVFSTVHCALLEELGQIDRIAGVCELEFIDSQRIRDGVRHGTIADLGNSLEPNIEKMADLRPDAILASPFENSGGYGLTELTDATVIECADYMEPTPLARAEWIRFYGRLFGAGELADSIFSAVERNYLNLADLARTARHRPTLIVDKPYQGIWYVSGGHSSMGTLYCDAGARYVFASRRESGSIPLSLEAAIDAGHDADFWLLKYSSPEPLTLSDLAQDNQMYRGFASFSAGNVFGCNTATSHFFEETPYHPERLLADFISILHPELGVSPTHKYYHRLDE